MVPSDRMFLDVRSPAARGIGVENPGVATRAGQGRGFAALPAAREIKGDYESQS